MVETVMRPKRRRLAIMPLAFQVSGSSPKGGIVTESVRPDLHDTADPLARARRPLEFPACNQSESEEHRAPNFCRVRKVSPEQMVLHGRTAWATTMEPAKWRIPLWA